MLFNLLFPRFCVGCGIPGIYLCFSCYRKIKHYIPQRCLYCNSASFGGFTHTSCKQKNGIDGVYSFFYYRVPVLNIIKRTKYRSDKRLLENFLNDIQPQCFFDWWDTVGIIRPVNISFIPTHKSVERARGFNQAHIIAHHFVKPLNVAVEELLFKNKYTQFQSLLSKSKRHNNIREAFSYIKNNTIPPHTTIIADDVITTGATIKEAARVLKKSGVGRVYAVSLLRSY